MAEENLKTPKTRNKNNTSENANKTVRRNIIIINP